MKIVALILSIYITALSIVPCADGMLQSSLKTDTSVSASDHDSKHSEHEDDCTPFCTCVCCGSLIVIPHILSFVKQSVVVSTIYQFHYTFDYSFDFKEGVWHPPAIS